MPPPGRPRAPRGAPTSPLAALRAAGGGRCRRILADSYHAPNDNFSALWVFVESGTCAPTRSRPARSCSLPRVLGWGVICCVLSATLHDCCQRDVRGARTRRWSAVLAFGRLRLNLKRFYGQNFAENVSDSASAARCQLEGTSPTSSRRRFAWRLKLTAGITRRSSGDGSISGAIGSFGDWAIR